MLWLRSIAIATHISASLRHVRGVQSTIHTWKDRVLAGCDHIRERYINPYGADFFQTIFHSFEAGIANAISSSE